jgi:hypothetical protein
LAERNHGESDAAERSMGFAQSADETKPGPGFVFLRGSSFDGSFAARFSLTILLAYFYPAFSL